MLPPQITRLIQHILQPALLRHHPPHTLTHISLEDNTTAAGQPPEDMKRIRIDARGAADAAIIWQAGVEDDSKGLEAPAVAQSEADEVGEAVQDVVV